MNSFKNKLPEYLAIAVILFLAIWLRLGYINYPHLPDGDEPSWMSVAAQLSKGEGFTTRWLERSFLDAGEFPRPADFRFPAFSLVLGLSFKLFGISFRVALLTQLVIALFALLALYFLIRRFFNKGVALAALLLSAISLEQIHWASRVYPETFYALGMYLLLRHVHKMETEKLRSWAYAALLLGLLYHIRPNALLLYPVFAGFFLYAGKQYRFSRLRALGVLALPILIASPWMARNYLYFHNPFYIAPGSSQALLGNPLHGFLLFFQLLIRSENGLIIPFLLLLPLSVFPILKRKNGLMIVLFCLAQLLPNFWLVSADWSAVRYNYYLWPLLYAAGLYTLWEFIGQHITKPRLKTLIPICVFAILLLPVVNPHRYYFRLYYNYPKPPAVNEEELIRFLQENLLPQERYMAAGTAMNLNFLTERNCISPPRQREEIPASACRFRVKYIIVSSEEDKWFAPLSAIAGKTNCPVKSVWQGESWKAYAPVF